MVDESDTMVRLPLLAGLTYREWHAFVNGIYKGSVEGGRKHEYEKEKHYWRAGYMAGALSRYVLLVYLIESLRE